MLLGVDLSSHNGNVDGARMRAAGVDFAICKVTEDTDYLNPYYARQVLQCRQNGIEVGHYHYARPDTDPADIAGEVEWFKVAADVRPGENVALDLEEAKAGQDLLGWASVWLQTVAAWRGKLPLDYSYKYFIQQHFPFGHPVFPFWYAWYPDQQPPAMDFWPPSPANWPDAAIWQYTANGQIDGITGVVDLNRFRGTIEDFRTIGLGERELARQRLWAWYQAKPEWERGLPGEARWFDADFADYGVEGQVFGLVYEFGAVWTRPQNGLHLIQPVLWGDWQRRATIE